MSWTAELQVVWIVGGRRVPGRVAIGVVLLGLLVLLDVDGVRAMAMPGRLRRPDDARHVTSATSEIAREEPRVSARGPYIVSRTYDWLFFLAPPMLALALGILVSGTPLATEVWLLAGEDDTLVGFFIGTLIHAHLVAVFFRSPGNPAIRKRYPIRFLVVPIVLWAAIVSSPWIADGSWALQELPREGRGPALPLH